MTTTSKRTEVINAELIVLEDKYKDLSAQLEIETYGPDMVTLGLMLKRTEMDIRWRLYALQLDV